MLYEVITYSLGNLPNKEAAMNGRRTTAGKLVQVWLLAAALFALAAGGTAWAQDVGDVGSTVSESISYNFV